MRIKHILLAVIGVVSPMLLSACYIEGGGCSGPFCFGVATEVCGDDLFCNDNDEPTGRCPDVDDIESQATRALNQLRSNPSQCEVATSQNSMSWNEQIFSVADLHSRDMASNNFVSATGSNGLGLRDRLGDFNPGYATQSVAGGFPKVQELFDAWSQDNNECAKLTSGLAVEFALACRYDGDSQFGSYWTLVMIGQ